ncbi:cytochrome c maturase subunit C [Olea europaea subsp. europaea]|uniref:Cytochrome c maturase subunit C (Mitochondrion) n=1 Tax=Olea europaea subsp. europaea TaxID=158383 RepID=A0A8S0UIJ3_OLEEU|nr:cytochrome c maturase subunit C [Olea europaea subsp. europaea]
MGAFSTLFTLVTGGFRGRPMWGTFWVWDARLTSVFISFLIYLGALCFQKLSVEPAPISIRAGPIDIPIIKSSVNWWNTSHQPGSISRSVHSLSLFASMAEWVKRPTGKIRRFDSCWMHLEGSVQSLLTEAFRFGFGASDEEARLEDEDGGRMGMRCNQRSGGR